MGVKRNEKSVAFGRELRRLRQERGFSQPQLAALIATDPTYISKAENGHRIPPKETVRAWDEALGAGGSLLALVGSSAPVRPAQLPPGIGRFFGRSDELELLDEVFATPAPAGSPIVVAIDGTAGIGKTTLALRWAHRASGRYADGQLYIDLRGFSVDAPVGPELALEEFLVAFGVAADAIPATVKQRAAMYRSLVADRSLLVVLDNAKDAEQVRPLLPASRHCAVLITSRDQLSDLVVSMGAHRVTLGPLAEAESVALISDAVGAERAGTEPDSVQALARHCSYLPLAMRMAAERVATHRWQSVGELVDELAQAEERLDVLGIGSGDAIRNAFSWSYDHVSAEQARMFRLLGLHPGPTISVTTAAAIAGVPTMTARRLLSGLAGVHLLETGPRAHYHFHDLLRDYAAELVAATETPAQRQAAVRRLANFYLHTAYASNVVLAPEREMPLTLPPVLDGVTPLSFSGFGPARDWCDAESVNFAPVAQLAVAHGEFVPAWQLSAVLWNYFVFRGPSHVWDACHRVAKAAARAARDPVGESWVLNNQAYLLRLRRDYAGSDRLYQRALDIRRRIGDAWGQAWSLVGMAMLNAEQARPTTTYEQASAALALFVELGNRHGQGVALSVIADACRDLGRFEEGLSCLSRAHAVFTGPRGRGHVLTKLGQLHRSRGATALAREALEQALIARRQAEHQAGTAETLTSLGEVLDDLGESAQAEECWVEALRIWDELGDVRAHDVGELVRSRRWSPRR